MHKVGYSGQRYEITVFDRDKDQRIVVGWAQRPSTERALKALELRPGWIDAQCEDIGDERLRRDQGQGEGGHVRY